MAEFIDRSSLMEILIHYGDLSLKGKNRGDFIRRLARNIETAAGGACDVMRDRIIMRGGSPSALCAVFGISWYAPCRVCAPDIDAITSCALSGLEERMRNRKSETVHKTFAVYSKRSDKRFAFKSSEISKVVGEKICGRFGLKVRISAPDIAVFIEVATNSAQVYFEKIPGAGGLPVGTSADVLCLLSGGIDSPVAALCAMKRGCAADFLHFHVFADSAAARQSKMAGVFGALKVFHPEAKMFFAPYKFFQKEVLRAFPSEGIFRGYELVLFRRFMLRVASSLALKSGYKAVVTGDSIGQVASQTVENIACASGGIDCLVMSPLLGWDKKEIVAKARRAGTYSHSIAPYNECCSILSSSPRTKCRPSRLRSLEQMLSIDQIARETASAIEIFRPSDGTEHELTEAARRLEAQR